ncbi:MAG TPA: trypsin-like peptidase domain-containing protein [Polyangiaceae bacterium]|jgi:serine protease Do|nr:trypsin-like peptidase domain-containing protein [Polyangiaceae bacterium]
MSSDKLSIPRKVVKAIALPIGALGSVLCLMAIAGLLSPSIWARLPAAVLITLAVPAVIADRLLPEDPKARAPGLVSDVFALGWLGFVLAFAIVAGSFTSRMLIAEGDRLKDAGVPWLPQVVYLLAGVDVAAPPVPTAETPVASASGSVAVPASAAPSARAVPPPVASAPPPSADGEMRDAEIFKRYAPAVVTVDLKKGPVEGGGTGFLLDKKGTIATNEHVIQDASAARIRFMGGAVYEEVWVLMVDTAADLALLQIDLSQPTEGKAVEVETVTLGDSDGVTVGERAVSIGNPLGLDHTLTTGIVSARRSYRGRQWIQMSTPVSPGNSGGPLFNGRGEVIGVTTAIIAGGFGGMAQNLNLAVPINELKARLKADYPGKKKLGSGDGPSHW